MSFPEHDSVIDEKYYIFVSYGDKGPTWELHCDPIDDEKVAMQSMVWLIKKYGENNVRLFKSVPYFISRMEIEKPKPTGGK
jgi:hypothetical protein